MSRTVGFLSAWKTEEQACEHCSWRGPSEQLVLEYFQDLLQADCPSCDKSVLLVTHPTHADIEAAAAAGVPEGIEMLRSLAKKA